MNNRHKDASWNLPTNKDGTVLWDVIHAALLMDLRDELKVLNAIFRCPDVRKIPRELRQIRLNTTKKKPKRK